MDNTGLRDIVIIGGGPAGLTAGMYVARSRMDALLIESFSVMGQATMTDIIENYPGVEKTTGYGLVSVFKKQAESFGLEISQSHVSEVSIVEQDNRRYFQIKTDSGDHKAISLIVASGASSKKLSVPGEDAFIGKGVSYCATCDGPFYRGMDVVVVGGGDTAVEEAIYLTRFAEKVTIVHRRNKLRSARILQERAMASGKIDFAWQSVVEEIIGDETVKTARVRNVVTGDISDIECRGVFIFVGWTPNTSFMNGIANLDKSGRIVVDNAMRSSTEGLFACGDCTDKILNQVVTAAGDGATAAFSSQKYVEEVKGTSY